MSLFKELKRRNVFRVGAAYLVMSWLLIQVVGTLTPMLELPDIIGRIVVLFLIMGFPVALIIAWAFEMTPNGIKPSKAVNPEESVAQETGQKLKNIVITGLALVLVLVVLDAYVLNDSGTALETTPVVEAEAELIREVITETANLEKTIAVLPFVNLSPDPEQEYFADGITEELLNSLTRLRGLQVTARTSSFFFKGKNIDLTEVGEILGVEYLLEGSVRKAGEQLRITAQLIKADDGFHLWSETYDRQLDDVFVIQEEISNAVASVLSIALGVGDALNRPGMTRDVEAFDFYLRSKDLLFYTASAADIRRMVFSLETAVSLDPDFALAWLRLAQIYAQMLDGALPILDTVRVACYPKVFCFLTMASIEP